MNSDIQLYASTYMIAMNSEAIDFLRKLGFSRVILDRHLMVDEISEIVRRSTIEIEIFVHGGGCSNINGNCYLYHFQSQALKRAQVMSDGMVKSPCALPYDVYDLDDGQKFLGEIPIMDAFEYCSLCNLPELMKIGITGFKIEGRGDTPSYQENATRVYRKLIDLLARGETESYNERLESFRSGKFVSFTSFFPNLEDVICRQKRCYYHPLFHAPYKIPLSWQAWTKSQLVTVL